MADERYEDYEPWEDDYEDEPMVVTRTLPDDYTIPQVGTRDMRGYAPNDSCEYRMPESGWICTLPYDHTCIFHVAHDSDGIVLQVHDLTPVHLRLPEGL